jgi:serine/threonine-protein kinase
MDRAWSGMQFAALIDVHGIIASPLTRRSFSPQVRLGSERNRHMLPVRITLTITKGVLKGEEYVFHDSARLVLGRSPDCDIALPMDLLHRDISRHHCSFEIDPPTVRVRDLNSLNGTYVNGEKIGQRPNPPALTESDYERCTRELRDGDEVRVGDTAIRIGVETLALVPMTAL